MSESIFNSAIKMQTFASEFANKVSKGTVVALIGNLGAGKTTFTQGFARGLGIDDHVISPTFKLVSEYQGDQMLYHVDCYRLDQPKDFLNIGDRVFITMDASVTKDVPDDAVVLGGAPASTFNQDDQIAIKLKKKGSRIHTTASCSLNCKKYS